MERKLMMYLPYSSSYLLLTNKKAGETKTGIQLRAGVSPQKRISMCWLSFFKRGMAKFPGVIRHSGRFVDISDQ